MDISQISFITRITLRFSTGDSLPNKLKSVINNVFKLSVGFLRVGFKTVFPADVSALVCNLGKEFVLRNEEII